MHETLIFKTQTTYIIVIKKKKKNLQQILLTIFLLQDIRALPNYIQTRPHETHRERYKFANYYKKKI